MDDLAQTQQQVDDAIAAARQAAQRAGCNLTDSEFGESSVTGNTAYCFELQNLPNASDLDELEAAIGEIPGVSVDIVYPTAQAWVTAPVQLSPTVIERAFYERGVIAHLSDSSLQRRVAWADVEDNRQYRSARLVERMQRNRPREYAEGRRQIQRSKQQGFLGPDKTTTHSNDSGGVLFTARALLTRRRLWVSLAFSLPVLLLSYLPAWQFPYWQWLVAVLSLPVVTYCAWPFHRATLAGAVRGMSALDEATSIAIGVSWVWSVGLLLFSDVGSSNYHMRLEWSSFDPTSLAQGSLFFDVACGITTIVLAGRITLRSRGHRYLDDLSLARLEPHTKYDVVVRNRATGKPKRIPTETHKLNVNDDIIVEPEAIVPVDGVVIGGSSSIEVIELGQKPVTVKVNSRVFAGTRNGSGRLKVRVTATGHRTWIAAIYRWVMRSSQQQLRADTVATATASTLVPISIILAGTVFVVWALSTHNLNQAMSTALAILACVAPTSLANSASIAARHTIEHAARNGVLVRDGSTLTDLAQVDKVIFNRVGALSNARMTVDSITAAPGESTDMVLRVAGALAMGSEHPVSSVLVRAYREARDVADDEFGGWIDVANAHIGEDSNFYGIVSLPTGEEEETESVEAVLWRPRELSELSGKLATAAAAGGTPVVVRWKGKDRGVITMHDDPKPDAYEAVEDLEALGVSTMMLSRDTYPVARRYADSMGVSHVLAGVRPREKSQAVRAVRRQGANLAVVGDSSVHSCFPVAQVGILLNPIKSLEDPSDLDQQDAKVVVFHDAVRPIPWLVAAARRLQRTIRINFAFAWSYHAVVFVLAAMGALHPMVASLLMLSSSVVIQLQSRRRAKIRLGRERGEFRRKYEPIS
ncbi:MAG: HAD family hydrolase [Corynebacterium sp.]|nr:HAD family hydrolase [Corynebacterium sp.]